MTYATWSLYNRALITESATFGLEECKTCYPFSRTRARARQYDDDDEHEHGFDPPGVADAMIETYNRLMAEHCRRGPGVQRGGEEGKSRHGIRLD
jgi:hypothetical protein